MTAWTPRGALGALAGGAEHLTVDGFLRLVVSRLSTAALTVAAVGSPYLSGLARTLLTAPRPFAGERARDPGEAPVRGRDVVVVRGIVVTAAAPVTT